jgi:hypothetical protein
MKQEILNSILEIFENQKTAVNSSLGSVLTKDDVISLLAATHRQVFESINAAKAQEEKHNELFTFADIEKAIGKVLESNIDSVHYVEIQNDTAEFEINYSNHVVLNTVDFEFDEYNFNNDFIEELRNEMLIPL